MKTTGDYLTGQAAQAFFDRYQDAIPVEALGEDGTLLLNRRARAAIKRDAA